MAKKFNKDIRARHAAAFRFASKLRSEGLGLVHIAERLTAEGVPKPLRGEQTPWRSSNVSHLLRMGARPGKSRGRKTTAKVSTRKAARKTSTKSFESLLSEIVTSNLETKTRDFVLQLIVKDYTSR